MVVYRWDFRAMRVCAMGIANQETELNLDIQLAGKILMTGEFP